MDGEQAQGPAVGQPVMDEVEAPAFVGPQGGHRPLGAAHELLLAPTPLPHLQTLGPVEPVDPLVVVGHALAA